MDKKEREIVPNPNVIFVVQRQSRIERLRERFIDMAIACIATTAIVIGIGRLIRG